MSKRGHRARRKAQKKSADRQSVPNASDDQHNQPAANLANRADKDQRGTFLGLSLGGWITLGMATGFNALVNHISSSPKVLYLWAFTFCVWLCWITREVRTRYRCGVALICLLTLFLTHLYVNRPNSKPRLIVGVVTPHAPRHVLVLTNTALSIAKPTSSLELPILVIPRFISEAAVELNFNAQCSSTIPIENLLVSVTFPADADIVVDRRWQAVITSTQVKKFTWHSSVVLLEGDSDPAPPISISPRQPEKYSEGIPFSISTRARGMDAQTLIFRVLTCHQNSAITNAVFPKLILESEVVALTNGWKGISFSNENSN